MQPAAGSASNTAAGGTTYGPAGPQTSAGEYRSNQRNISKCVLIFIDKYKYEADLKAAVLNALETSKTPLCRLAGKISLGFCSFLVSCFSNKLEGNGEKLVCMQPPQGFQLCTGFSVDFVGVVLPK